MYISQWRLNKQMMRRDESSLELADFKEKEKSQDSTKLSRPYNYFRLSFKINVLPCRQQRSDNDVRTQATFVVNANLRF